MRNPIQPAPEANTTEAKEGQAGAASDAGPVMSAVPPRPDGVSFHVLFKTLVNVSRWDDAMEILEELCAERWVHSVFFPVLFGGFYLLFLRFRLIWKHAILACRYCPREHTWGVIFLWS